MVAVVVAEAAGEAPGSHNREGRRVDVKQRRRLIVVYVAVAIPMALGTLVCRDSGQWLLGSVSACVWGRKPGRLCSDSSS